VTGQALVGFAARRLAWAAASAALAAVVAFVVFWKIPNVQPEYELGGGDKGTEATRAAARVAYGLDEPLPVQFFNLVRESFAGRLECHFACGNVRTAFVESLPVTFWLVGVAIALAAALATAIALLCVRYHGRPLDRFLLGVAAAMHSIPSLVLSVVLWTLLCERAELFPFDGYTPLTEDPARWAWHLALPWVAAALPLAGAYVPVLRASLLEVRAADWVRTARAKGLSERAVVRRHVFRNALGTPVTILGLDASHAFGGFVLYIEVVFGVPGIGGLTEASLKSLDLPAIFAITVWLAIIVALVNATVDIAVAALDPRGR